MIKFAGRFGLTKETPVELFLHVYIAAHTGKKDFDSDFPFRAALLGEKYSTRSTVSQQLFQYTRAQHFANQVLPPGHGHAEAPL
jgi:hypothetical protein